MSPRSFLLGLAPEGCASTGSRATRTTCSPKRVPIYAWIARFCLAGAASGPGLSGSRDTPVTATCAHPKDDASSSRLRAPWSKSSSQCGRVTRQHLLTETKTRLTRLRDSLSLEEQSLLTLRVDRGLEFGEIAEVLAESDLDAPALKRAAASWRKRFGRLTDKLRELARAEGLVGDD